MSERGADDGVDTVEQPLHSEGARKKGGFLRKLWVGIVVGTIVWVVGAGAVLWWQPGRIVQVGVIAVVVVAALMIPRKHLDRVLSAFGCLLLIAALFYLPSFLLTNEVEFTIRNTDRDSAREIYLVHTDRGAKTESDTGETFQNVDAPLLWKVNSSDVQGQAETLKGKRVRARVFGFRIMDFSRYRNIIWIEPVGGA